MGNQNQTTNFQSLSLIRVLSRWSVESHLKSFVQIQLNEAQRIILQVLF